MRTITPTGLSVEVTVAIRVSAELDLSTADALLRVVAEPDLDRAG